MILLSRNSTKSGVKRSRLHGSLIRSSASPLDVIFCSEKLNAPCFDTQNVDLSKSVSGYVSIFQQSNDLGCLKFTFLVGLLPLPVIERARIKNQIRLFD
jgi:hypothetical protein